ncbi:hypothetical protein C818_04225 [Lachnospiraceae bacterium MD308]|nr:hypothetical protein C818_04225 [Lachnospiraceae bacterium MD308]
MITNADLTIFNKRRIEKATGRPVYFRTWIKGVSFYTDQKVRVTEDAGVISKDIYKVRIPEDADTEGKPYVDAEKYKSMTDEEAAGCWTIDNDDLFGKGLLPEFEKEADFLRRQYTGKVVSFSDNQRGGLPHFRIGGV